MHDDHAATVRRLLLDWAAAIAAGDRAAILAHHDRDLLMYDFPSVVRGVDAYNETWDFFYANPKGPIQFSPRDIEITAGAEVAFATCLIHCDGTSAGALDLRLTMGLVNRNGQWTVTHEHHSVPTTEKRFLGPEAK